MLKQVFILILMCTSCQVQNKSHSEEVFEHIEDKKARAIIQRSIEDAGGLDKWRALKSIVFKKDFFLFDSSGTVDKRFKQEHNYSFSENRISIRSQENQDILFTTLVDSVYARSKNGEELDLSQESLRKSINSSTYVLGIPFKLIDSGADISYLGEQVLNNRSVDVVQVSYDPAKHDNHSSKNVWKFYFDTSNGRIVANWIESSDHFNIVENLEYTRVNGLLFHKHRKSYRVNEKGEKLYLRAEYRYFDYTSEH